MPVPADAALPSSAYLWWAMTSIVLGGYISVLNSHVINVVIPKMMSGLGTDIVTIRWVVTVYMLANAVVMPLVGWLARVLGARISTSTACYSSPPALWPAAWLQA